MSIRIKAGDYVSCISTSSYPLTIGKIYQVISIKKVDGSNITMTELDELYDMDGYNIVFDLVNDSGFNGLYYASRFEYDLVSNRRKKLERLRSL